MKKLLLTSLLAFGLPSVAYANDDYCEAIALHDIPAFNNPTSIIQRGSKITYISQVLFDKETKTKRFCIKGGYCYVLMATFFKDDKPLENIEMLRFINCKIGGIESQDDTEVQYHLIHQ